MFETELVSIDENKKREDDSGGELTHRSGTNQTAANNLKLKTKQQRNRVTNSIEKKEVDQSQRDAKIKKVFADKADPEQHLLSKKRD